MARAGCASASERDRFAAELQARPPRAAQVEPASPTARPPSARQAQCQPPHQRAMRRQLPRGRDRAMPHYVVSCRRQRAVARRVQAAPRPRPRRCSRRRSTNAGAVRFGGGLDVQAVGVAAGRVPPARRPVLRRSSVRRERRHAGLRHALAVPGRRTPRRPRRSPRRRRCWCSARLRSAWRTARASRTSTTSSARAAST